jgi:lipid-A-disaccharide synthase-like uncharacterized protein
MSPVWVIIILALAVFGLVKGISWKLILFVGGLLFVFFIMPQDALAIATDIGNGFSTFIHQYNLH